MTKPLPYLIAGLACYAIGFLSAWVVQSSEVERARAQAHSADLTQHGASMMADECVQRLDVCELGLEAADAALDECAEETAAATRDAVVARAVAKALKAKCGADGP